jgi:hypothetical protein
VSDPRRAILTVLEEVGRDRGIEPTALLPQRGLVDIGFKSIDLARVVALAEIRLGVDPFETRPITDIRTVGDLCRVFEDALAGRPASSSAAESASRPSGPDRGAARRRRAARQDAEEA